MLRLATQAVGYLLRMHRGRPTRQASDADLENVLSRVDIPIKHEPTRRADGLAVREGRLDIWHRATTGTPLRRLSRADSSDPLTRMLSFGGEHLDKQPPWLFMDRTGKGDVLHQGHDLKVVDHKPHTMTLDQPLRELMQGAAFTLLHPLVRLGQQVSSLVSSLRSLDGARQTRLGAFDRSHITFALRDLHPARQGDPGLDPDVHAQRGAFIDDGRCQRPDHLLPLAPAWRHHDPGLLDPSEVTRFEAAFAHALDHQDVSSIDGLNRRARDVKRTDTTMAPFQTGQAWLFPLLDACKEGLKRPVEPVQHGALTTHRELRQLRISLTEFGQALVLVVLRHAHATALVRGGPWFHRCVSQVALWF